MAYCLKHMVKLIELKLKRKKTLIDLIVSMVICGDFYLYVLRMNLRY